jgi:hypothetical protein
MAKTEQCAHPACSCTAAEDSKYCSEVCADAKGMTELACQCKHPVCQGTTLTT